MNALAAALVKAQAAMPAVEDNARANYGTYVTLDHLIAKTRNILNEHGLAIVQFPSVSELGAPTLRTILIHGESGEKLEADCPLFLNGKQDMQALGGAITYARRYGWGAALGISTDQDDDGNAVSALPAENGSSSPAPAPGRQGAAAPLTETHAAAPAFPTDEFRFTGGKHAGKTFAEVPRDYAVWCAENHPKPEVQEVAKVWLGLTSPALDDDDIPF